MARASYQQPSWRLSALEVRASVELVSHFLTSPLRRNLPKGDGHTVLVLPGFLAPDLSTAPLRSTLGRLGYDAVGWEQGVNFGPRKPVVDGLRRRLLDLAADSGGTVSIVGWSLGGIYARFLARDQAHAVRSVITLASPFRMIRGDRSRATPIYEALELPQERWIWQRLRDDPLLVPATSIFTRLDGVVDWRACLDEPSVIAENVEVRGASHLGLGHNPTAIYVIADRLAQPEGAWRPFIVPGHLRQLLRHHVPEEGTASTL